jgi:hypothetical protein
MGCGLPGDRPPADSVTIQAIRLSADAPGVVADAMARYNETNALIHILLQLGGGEHGNCRN